MKTPASSNKFMIFLLLYLYILPYLTGSISVYIADIFFGNYQYLLIATGMLSFFGFFVPIIFVCKLKQIPIGIIIPHKKLSAGSILILIFIGILLIPISSFFSVLSSLFVTNNVNTFFSSAFTAPFLLQTFCIAIVPAVFEEMMFRGFIIYGYKNAKVWQIAFISGLFFGLMHLDFNQFSYAFPLGAYFAVAVYYSGSIFSSMLLHFIVNFSQVLSIYLFRFLMNDEQMYKTLTAASTFTETFELLESSFVSAAVASVIIVFLTKIFISINKENALSQYKDNENNPPILIPSFFIVLLVYAVLMAVQCILYNILF